MKYFQINNNCGFFRLDNSTEFISIEKISKDDILKLIKKIIESEEEFEMDPYNDDLMQNKAHNIIYKNLHQKFEDLKQEKNNIIDDTNQKFESAYQKYSN